MSAANETSRSNAGLGAKVVPLRNLRNAPELEWVVTIEVKPRIAFLRKALKAYLLRKPLRIRHTFTKYPHELPPNT